MLVAREKPGFQALSKGHIVLLCVEADWQGVIIIIIISTNRSRDTWPVK